MARVAGHGCRKINPGGNLRVNFVPDVALVDSSLLGTGLVCGVGGRRLVSPELRAPLSVRRHGVSGLKGRHTFLGLWPPQPRPWFFGF
jgi:hypothetical protein